MEAVKLLDGKAPEIAGIVQNLMASEGSQVRIAVNEATNSLLVSGQEDDVAAVREIIKKLVETGAFCKI